MPMYDYKCSACGHDFEAIQPISKREESDCPECGARAVKLPSTPRVKLDGISGDFPGEYMKWEKKRKQHMAQEMKKSYFEEK